VVVEQVTAVVDFGSSHTVIVVSGPGLPARLVPVDGEPWFPSAVFWGRDGRGVVGRDALRLGRAEPARLERRPKARLGEDEVLLGDAVVPTYVLVRHVLVRAVAEAVTTVGAPVAHLVLTHPADWGPARLGALLTAAQGVVPRVSTVAEPVAAAAWFATEHELPIDAMLAVLDFGGGTCDVALVRREAAGLTVVACAGLPDLGGDDLDQRVVDRLAAGRDELARRLDDDHIAQVPAAELAELSRFRDDVRAAKEVLSRHPQTDLVLPADLPDALLTRDEFEQIVRPDLARAVELLDSTVRSAGLTGSDLAAVQLVGGSSRVPLLAQLLRAWTNAPVRLDDQPEAVVALGAEVATRVPARPRPAAGVDGGADRGPDVTGPVRIPAPEPAPAPARWRATPAAVAIIVVTVLGLAAFIGIRGFDVTVAGSAQPLPGGPRLVVPPPTPGEPVSVPGRSTASLPEIQPGEYVTYVHVTSNIEWRLDSFDDSDETGRQLAGLGNPSAPGHHWALVRYTVKASQALEYDPDVRDQIYVVDDRGLMISTVDSFTSPANRARVTLPDDCPRPATEPIAAGTELARCALYAVPDTTPITEVAIAAHANAHPLPTLNEATERRGARVAVDGREVAGDPPVPPGEVRPRGSAVSAQGNGFSADVAVADVVEDSSAYLDEDTTIVLGGSRALIARIAVRLEDPAPASSLLDISVALVDDRGAPVDPSVSLRTYECVNALAEEDVSGLVTLCVLFAVPAEASPSAAIVQVGVATDPLVWSLR
jgi:actin-like ATPase involved in cell morphogenesis